MIADIELEYDSPIPDYCGSCQKCIEACPTDAIVSEYVLDSSKCLSFLTIENRENAIPEPEAHHMEGWIYGCDICQNVCPWNISFEHATDDPPFEAREANVNRDLIDWLGLSVHEYRERFRHSPVKRAKYEGLQRNVRAALGQQM